MKIHLIDSTGTLLKAVEKQINDVKLEASITMDIEHALDDIQKINPSIVVMNWTNSSTGIEDLCRKVRRLKLGSHTYIIIIAPRERENNMSAVLDAGASDFIFKPVSKKEFALRVNIAQRIIKVEDSAARLKKKLIKHVKEDPQTSLLNRRALLDEGLKEMVRASRDNKNFSAIMVSASNFKRIISSYGADMGDQVLLEFSRRLKLKCRPYDIAGRYGISEFLVFLPDTGVDNAEKVSKRILSSIADKPYVYHGRKLSISVSMGVSELNYEDVVNNNNMDAHLVNDLLLDALIKRSELACEKAIKAGRNSIVVESK